MLRRLVVLALLLVACGGEPGADTAPTSTTPTTTTSPVETTSLEATSTTLPEECGRIPYSVGSLPGRADPERPEPDEIPQDAYTTIPGTRSDMWFDREGSPVVAFVRGALPPEEWPGDRGEVSIDGARGVAGPFPDGTWVVAWYEAEGDRCDQYFMVFYPPVDPSEVEATIESLDRTAG